MLFSIIIISVLGTLLHFTYDLSNHNKIVGLFSAVNESTWEHIKMALTATFIYSLIDGILYGSNPNYMFAKFISLLVIILLIPLIFYGYKLFTKKSVLIIDILLFYVAIICSQLSFFYILNMNELPFIYRYIGIVGTIILFGSYLLLTLLPLKNFLFKDPLTKKYGLSGHKKD